MNGAPIAPGVGDGDAPEIEDANYHKMMRRLRGMTRKGGEFDAVVLEELEKQEEDAKNAKKRKKKGGGQADAAVIDEPPVLIQTKRARAAATGASEKEDLAGNGANDDNEEEDDNSDDDDDPSKILPAFIRECMDDPPVPLAATDAAMPFLSGRAPSATPAAAAASTSSTTGAPVAADAAAASTAEAGRNVMDDDYYRRVEAIISASTLPGMLQSLPLIWIQNLVVTAFSEMYVNIEHLIPHLMPYGVYQNKRRFVAMTQRTCHPRSSTLAFGNGKFVNTGSQTEKAALASIEAFVAKIASVETQITPGVFVRPYAEMRIRKCTVHNMVGSTRTPFSIDLHALARYPFVKYYEKLFVGAIVTVAGISNQPEDRDVKALVFRSGSVVITGTKTTSHISAVNRMIYPYLARCAVQTGLPAEMRATKTRQRRFEADKRKAKALPADSQSVIQIDPNYLVDEFRAVNSNRETAQQALARERERFAGDLSQIPTATMNLIAMSSMYERTRAETDAEHNRPSQPRAIELLPR